MIALSLSAPPKSFVADLVIMAATGGRLADTEMDPDIFNTAVGLMRDASIEEFADITGYLNENECDATAVYGCPVTPETDDAFAAYLAHAI